MPKEGGGVCFLDFCGFFALKLLLFREKSTSCKVTLQNYFFPPNIKFHPKAEFILAASACPYPRQVPAGAAGSGVALSLCPLGHVPGGGGGTGPVPGTSPGALVGPCHGVTLTGIPVLPSLGRKPMLVGGVAGRCPWEKHSSLGRRGTPKSRDKTAPVVASL